MNECVCVLPGDLPKVYPASWPLGLAIALFLWLGDIDLSHVICFNDNYKKMSELLEVMTAEVCHQNVGELSHGKIIKGLDHPMTNSHKIHVRSQVSGINI